MVAIDRESLASLGPWPWPRDRIAAILDRLAEAAPAAIATDILFEAPDRAAPAVLARRLADALPPDESAALRLRAARLPDHDSTLAISLAAAPVALGFLLAPEPTPPPASPGGFAVLGSPAALTPLAAPGAAIALPALVAAAAGHGAASLEGGRVRAVPLVVRVGDELRPGLVLEALRLALGGSSPLLDAAGPAIRLPQVVLPLDEGLSIRLHPGAPLPTVSAAALLAGEVPSAAIQGHIVLLGGTAPELGALREAGFAPLVPGIRLQAEALAQAMTLWLPRRPAWLDSAEIAAAAALSLLGAAAGAVLPPLALAGFAVAALFAVPVGVLALLSATMLLADPLLPLAALLAPAAIAALAAFIATRASRARLVARFAQSLPPALVARIAREPGLVRIGGEARRMSFVFTDIAGFTTLVERSGPAALIGMLDAYIAGAAEIIARHGGTLDKVVGDALHVMFGAPLDQPGHERHAVACGIALAEYGQDFARRHAAEGFGITRVGIATGVAIVGDVGGGRVLDYTAHGDAVNLAARLEQANKIFGTTVLLDGETAAAQSGEGFRCLGRLAARGRSAAVDVYAPWDAPQEARTAWDEGLAALLAEDADAARAAFTRVAALLPEDAPTLFQLDRLNRGFSSISVDQRGG
ncbi:adenylate/guanylate cyclase domain-containing protein [Roseomonas stagni]|uniref:Adenylate/guanylate cyclase domain-containing protein n=2 Tax=Falsiroseomonas algicola TaxID=2716930 RepID=A0A6M1LGF9_9PROT|nr:adenylate/guanylate cyclase domain-containing protein [Falsiroseomonas algicola]